MSQEVWIVGHTFALSQSQKGKSYPLWSFCGAFSSEDLAVEACKNEEGEYVPGMWIAPTIIDGMEKPARRKDDEFFTDDNELKWSRSYSPYYKERKEQMGEKIEDMVQKAIEEGKENG